MTGMPPFDVLRFYYPDDPSADAVKKLIGGAVDDDWITNTCCIRLSRALNKAGVKLKMHDAPFMHTVTGADGDQYAFRLREMRPWIAAKFGAPGIDLKGGAVRSKFAGVVGVIAFDIHFHDSSGHIDLWDGSHYVHESADNRDYFKMSTRTMVWAAPILPVTSPSVPMQGPLPVPYPNMAMASGAQGGAGAGGTVQLAGGTVQLTDIRGSRVFPRT